MQIMDPRTRVLMEVRNGSQKGLLCGTWSLETFFLLCVKRKSQSKVVAQPHTRSQSKILDGKMKTCRNDAHCISLNDLIRAENTIIMFCQRQRYPYEIAKLEKSAGKGLSRKSTIYRLDPVLEDGVLRVGGRLRRAAMPEEAKRPMTQRSACVHTHSSAHTSATWTWRAKSCSLAAQKKILDHQCQLCSSQSRIQVCNIQTLQRKGRRTEDGGPAEGETKSWSSTFQQCRCWLFWAICHQERQKSSETLLSHIHLYVK